MRTRYYRFHLETGRKGLIRRRDDGQGYVEMARLSERRWIRDQDLYRYFVNPGDIWLVEVSKQEALDVAASFGAELEEQPSDESSA